MKKSSLIATYDKMTLSKDIDEQIKSKILKRAILKVQYIKYVYRLAVIMLVFTVIVSFQPVKATIKKVINHFSEKISYTTKNGDKETITMQGDYLKIRKSACKNDCKMDTISQISKELGIPLLKSRIEFKSENAFVYRPFLSKTNIINGVSITNPCYAVGDLVNVTMTSTEDLTSNSMIEYEVGESYKSPIAAQITIRTDNNSGVDYNNHELEYAGANWDLTIENKITDINLYKIESLNVTAVLYSQKSDGLEVWQQPEKPIKEFDLTSALFLYNGVEYCYYGAVSQKTMSEFLETLS